MRRKRDKRGTDIDCVVECPQYVYIMEFKLNGSAVEAVQQIKEKGYALPYAADKRRILASGINFSSEKGRLTASSVWR